MKRQVSAGKRKRPMKPPEVFREHLKSGEIELQAEKIKHQESILFYLANRRADTDRSRIRSWALLQTDARIDLGNKLSEYVDWKVPDNWCPTKNTHWLYIRIPGLSTIVAEYKRWTGSSGEEWYQDRWGVCCNEQIDGVNVNFWKVFNKEDRSLQYVLALAREQFLKQSKLEVKKAEVIVEEVKYNDDYFDQAVS